MLATDVRTFHIKYPPIISDYLENWAKMTAVGRSVHNSFVGSSLQQHSELVGARCDGVCTSV